MDYDEFFFLEALEEAVLKSDRRTMSILKRNWSEPMSVASSNEFEPYRLPRNDPVVGQTDFAGVKIKIEPEEYQFADQGFSGSFVRTDSVPAVQPASSAVIPRPPRVAPTRKASPPRAPILESVLRSQTLQQRQSPLKVKAKKFKRSKRTRLTEKRRPPKTKTVSVPAKKAANEAEPPAPSDEIVEDIWHVSLENKNGLHSMRFLVKWEGFPPSENTFEPYEHISHLECVKEFTSRKFETLETRVQAMLKNLIRDQTELIESYNSNEKLLNEKLLRFDPLLFKCQILALLYTQENISAQVPSTCPFMRKLRQDNVLYKFYMERESKKPKPSPKRKKVTEPVKKTDDSDTESARSSAEALQINGNKSDRDIRLLKRSCAIGPDPKLNGDLQYHNDDSNSTQPHVMTESEKIQFIERALGKPMAVLDNPLDHVPEFEPVVRVAIKKRKGTKKRRISKKDFRSFDCRCDICGSTFTRRDNLETHIVTMHSENPPIYKCTSCPYETKWRRSLRTHEMTHTKPVECTECLLMFPNEAAMRKHKCAASRETILTF